MFKPMLATDAELDKLRFPLLASPKLDGVRAIVRNGVVYSRSNKPIPNPGVQAAFKEYEHYDGELIVGSPTNESCYRDTVSDVMKHEGDSRAFFYVFDHVEELTAEYTRRQKRLIPGNRVLPLQQRLITDHEHLMTFESNAVTMGYEGLILRSPDAPYKCGRSTVREGYLLKLKRFLDDEAEVIGFEERMHNGNEATISELGYTKRSSHKENKRGRGDLGALVCRTSAGVEFSIGTGFTDSERAAIWRDRDQLLGTLAKFKYFPVGVKEAPRHPVFLGWRAAEDIS